jgi:hypothetical protein
VAAGEAISRNKNAPGGASKGEARRRLTDWREASEAREVDRWFAKPVLSTFECFE